MTRSITLAAALALGLFAAGAAQAGTCPADKVLTTPQPVRDAPDVGVTCEILTMVPLQGWRGVGELFLRNERITEGIRWLNSALEIDPKHAATHRTLAEHYEKTGQKDLAQKHRAQAGS
jgi:tetratricopeptide (TPR) repeat protein